MFIHSYIRYVNVSSSLSAPTTIEIHLCGTHLVSFLMRFFLKIFCFRFQFDCVTSFHLIPDLIPRFSRFLFCLTTRLWFHCGGGGVWFLGSGEMAEEYKEALLNKHKYHEGCPGCKVEQMKQLRRGYPYLELSFVWIIVLSTCNSLPPFALR